MNQQPVPDNNQGPFQGFQAAESTFVPKSSIDQKKSAMNQPAPDNSGPFQGFQVAESTFIPKSSLDQRRSQMTQQQQQQPQGGQNQPFSTGIVNSVYQQGPQQNFQSYGHPQQSGFMPPQNQNFHQSQNPYGGYNPYQQPPHGFSQGPQGGNFNMPGHGQGPEPTQNQHQSQNINQQQAVNQSRNIAQSGINKGGDQSEVMGLPDLTKFTNEDPMKGQSVNPYQGQPANLGASQKPFYQQNQDFGGNNNPYAGGQSTANNNNNPYFNPHSNTGGYDPMASKIGANDVHNTGGNPYGGNDKMNLENTGKASVQQPVNKNLQSNIRETVTPQPQANTRGGNVTKPTGNINVPVDKHSQLKELCLMAISELDYKNVKEAKDDIRRALDIIRQYES